MSATGKTSLLFKLKSIVVKISLLALGVSFELLSKFSPEMQKELEDWDEGRVFSLGVYPGDPMIAVKQEGNRLKYLGTGDHGAELKILFKRERIVGPAENHLADVSLQLDEIEEIVSLSDMREINQPTAAVFIDEDISQV